MEENAALSEHALEEALHRADAAQDALEATFRQLSAAIDLTGATEDRLTEHRRQRDEALLLLGRQVLGWFRAGGSLLLDTEEVEEVEAIKEEPEPEPAGLPEPPAAEAPPIERRRPSAESLEALTRQGIGSTSRWHKPQPPASPLRLDKLLDELGAPDQSPPAEELERLAQINPHTWRDLGQEAQRDLLALFAAWGRHLQTQISGQQVRFNQYFGRLTEFSELEQPGFVYGLKRDHTPRGASWLDDARQAHARLLPPAPKKEPPTPEQLLRQLRGALDAEEDIRTAVKRALREGVRDDDPRLLAMLAERLDALDDAPELRKLRKNLRRAARKAAPREAPVFAPWPRHSETAGMRVVIVGGDRPRRIRQLKPALKAVFGFKDVRWESGRKVRKVDQIRQSIQREQYDLCLLTTNFISHKTSGPLVAACKEHRVHFLDVGSGPSVGTLLTLLPTLLGEPPGT